VGPYKALSIGLLLLGIANWAVLFPWWSHQHAGPAMPYVLSFWAAAAAMGALSVWPEQPAIPLP
jgi:hypothetical protein